MNSALTGNPTENSRCRVVASRALNMPCSFGQSVRSIESRCVVVGIRHRVDWLHMSPSELEHDKFIHIREIYGISRK